MDLDDRHLCLRCGRIVEGLDNYVSHRQQLCYKFQQPSFSPFLSDTSKHLTSIESQVEDVFPHDISKLSADDFFLSLNLQSNYKTVDPRTNLPRDIQKSIEHDFCSSKLEIPVNDNELVDAFASDKQLCTDQIIDDNDCLGDILEDEKWDSFKLPNDICEPSQLFLNKDMAAVDDVESQTLDQSPSISPDKVVDSEHREASSTVPVNDSKTKRSKKKQLKQYSFSQFTIMNVPRTSYRQKINANGSLMCCQDRQKFYKCALCNLMFTFASTFLDHLLKCPKKSSDIKVWTEDMYKNEFLFVRSMHFKCLLCLFYCGDSFEFLEHLRSPSHLQNAASLKNPLICLPCQDEYSASDEIRVHFSKTHLQYSKGDHPVIIAEKKKNVHCCYCLTLIRSSSHLQAENDVDKTQKEDIDLLKNSFAIVPSCAYGVGKSLLNSYTTKATSYISSADLEVAENAISNSCDMSEELCITSVSVKEPLKIKISKSLLNKGDQNTKENIDKLVDPVEENRGRLVAKITSQNGKFMYTKLKIRKSSKIFLCVQCGAKRINEASLVRHMSTCEIVLKEKEKSLKQKYKILKNKKQTNTKFLCDKCPYIGRSFNQLTRHSRSHSGLKPFKCPDCKYSFALSSQLIRHKRLHTGQKPYNCPYCSYTCNTQENLRKHILKTKKHKGKMVYPCQYCAYESNEFSTYRDHLIEDHSDQFPNGVTNSIYSDHDHLL